MSWFRFLSTLIATALLPGCGGGGSSDPPHVAGDLDPSFSGDGILNGPSSISWTVDIQSTGRIVAAGSVSGTSTAFKMAAFDSTGLGDGTFGSFGEVVTDPSAGQDQAFAMLVQPDDCIVLVGELDSGSGAALAVLRYTPEGALDPTFDGDGIATLSIGGFATIGLAVTFQADGKLLVAADASNGSNRDFAVVRFNSNGSLDTAFDGDGYALIDFAGDDDLPFSISLDSSERIVVGGYSFTGANHHMSIVRLNSDGSMDTTFDTDGKRLLTIGSAQSAIRSIQLLADDRIIAAGGSVEGGFLVFTVLRFATDGSMDATFGTSGVTTIAFGATNSEAFAALLLPDGKVLLGGSTPLGPSAFALARVTTTGSVDTSYGSGGKVVTPVSGGGTIRRLVLQENGRVVVVGTSSKFLLARYFN